MKNLFRKKRFYILVISFILLAGLALKTTDYDEILLTYIANIKEFNNMRVENERLRNTLATYEELSAKKYSLEHEKKDLKSIIKATKDLGDYNLIQATVTKREQKTWDNNVTINKGANDNIELNMAVLTADGLIGQITKVNNATSVVTLLTSSGKNSRVSAIVQNNSKVSGLVKVQEADDEVKLTFEVNSDADIKSGDIITTSGMARYPKGIKIGTVTDIEMDNFSLSKIAYLQPSADFYDINHVIIINKK